MRYATVALSALIALAASQAAAQFPSFFSKGRPGSSQDAEKSWWGNKQPSFSLLDSKPKTRQYVSSSNKPSVIDHVVYPFKQVGHGVEQLGKGTGRVIRKSTRWMIPRSKPAPVQTTGSNSMWTRSSRRKSQPQSSGFSSWFRPEPKAPETLGDWFNLKRMDP